MNTVNIDCAEIAAREDLHTLFAESLALPPYYGGNLDALFDCLTDISEPTTLILTHVQEMLDALGNYGRAAVSMMRRAERESEGMLHIIMR